MLGWFLFIGCIIGTVFVAARQSKEAVAHSTAPIIFVFKVPVYLFTCALTVFFFTYFSGNGDNSVLYWLVFVLMLLYSVAFVIYRIWFLFKNYPGSAK